jgi:cytochrome c-type biogenesis protein CcmE
MELLLIGVFSAAALAFVAYPLVSSKRHLYYLDDMLGAGDQKKLAYLYSRRNVVYDNLRDLDNEFQMGKLSAADHQRLRDGLMAEAGEIVREIDAAHVRREVEDAIERDVHARRKVT